MSIACDWWSSLLLSYYIISKQIWELDYNIDYKIQHLSVVNINQNCKPQYAWSFEAQLYDDLLLHASRYVSD